MDGKNNLRYKALVEMYNACSLLRFYDTTAYQYSSELIIPTLYTKDFSSTYFKRNKTS